MTTQGTTPTTATPVSGSAGFDTPSTPDTPSTVKESQGAGTRHNLTFDPGPWLASSPDLQWDPARYIVGKPGTSRPGQSSRLSRLGTAASSRAYSLVPLAAMAPAVGVRPPGLGNLTTIIGWVTFLAGLACLVAFVAAMGKGGISALKHGQFEGGAPAAIALVCGVALTATGALFGAIGITT